MKNKIIFVMGFLMLSLFLNGCNQVSQEQKNEKLNVIVSVLPQKAFVNAVGGDLVNVKEIIPPGGSPATYEPRPSDLILVEKADIYFRIGHISFEKSHIEKFAGLNPDMKIIDTSINVELRHFGKHDEHTHENQEELAKDYGEHNEGEPEHEEEYDLAGIDPHTWLSPIQVKKQVDIIAQTLSQHDSANANVYYSNAEKYKDQLDALHSEIESIISELKTDKLLVFHPAWGYFADDYGLEQIAIEDSGKEPTARQLQHLIQDAKENGIKVIFVQSQFNKEIAESIAKEIGAVVVSVNPLSDDYIHNLRNIAIIISENLKQ
jgi:zinc transport system substrate-binding protein